MAIDERQKARKASLRNLMNRPIEELEKDRDTVEEFLKDIRDDLNDAYLKFMDSGNQLMMGQILNLLEELSQTMKYDNLLRETIVNLDTLRDKVSEQENPSTILFQ